MEEAQPQDITTLLEQVETRLRTITPAKLYADMWVDPTTRNLTKVFNHLRTMQRILYGYLPRQVISSVPDPGSMSYKWEEGSLMFTDLAGFTPLLEKTSQFGKEGAQALFEILNKYFTEMINIISKAGGNLLEFTGDAVLVQFPTDQHQTDVARAVRAGLRMQRAMKDYKNFEIMDFKFTIEMRLGIHVGKFLTSDIGTPYRMVHSLMGDAVLKAKKAEGAGKVGRVCLTSEARERVEKDFEFEDSKDGFSLIVDNLDEEQLGDYDITAPKVKLPSMVLMDASTEGMVAEISDAIDQIEPLASFIPEAVLRLLVENATSKGVQPDFPMATVIFVIIQGLPDEINDRGAEFEETVVSTFSKAISLINAEIESEGGVMHRVSYHHSGPDIMAYFGVPVAHTNDAERAARTARAIVDTVKRVKPIKFEEESYKLFCKVGLTHGQVFAAEFGDRQGRREFNLLGNVVNTSARLMAFAEENQILISEEVYKEIKDSFNTEKIENVKLKGRSEQLTVYELGRPKR